MKIYTSRLYYRLYKMFAFGKLGIYTISVTSSDNENRKLNVDINRKKLSYHCIDLIEKSLQGNKEIQLTAIFHL